MNLIVLAASGATGRELTKQALERGHSVTAVVRNPTRISLPSTPNLRVVQGDVDDAPSIARALGDGAIVLSGLGVTDRDRAGVLTAGAHAVVAARPQRIVWLGAFGSGPSGDAAGWATRTLLKLMGDRLTDKVTADAAILRYGGTVFHAGPLANGPRSESRRTLGLEEAPRRFFPARVTRATVAAAMLDEAEAARFVGRIAVPVER